MNNQVSEILIKAIAANFGLTVVCVFVLIAGIKALTSMGLPLLLSIMLIVGALIFAFRGVSRA